MSQTQIAAAQTLLRKVLPDLKVSEADVSDDGELNVIIDTYGRQNP